MWPVLPPTVPLEPVQIIGTYGWPSVPEGIKQATKILAARYYKLGDAPFDVAGFGEYGSIRVSVPKTAMEVMRPYARRGAIAVA